MVGRRIQDLWRKIKKKTLKDRLVFKDEQDGMPLKLPNWNKSRLDSVLNGCLNSGGPVKELLKALQFGSFLQ